MNILVATDDARGMVLRKITQMKNFLLLLAANLVSLTCSISALYLAANDKNGWGWFLFVAFFSSVYYEKKK